MHTLPPPGQSETLLARGYEILNIMIQPVWAGMSAPQGDQSPADDKRGARRPTGGAMLHTPGREAHGDREAAPDTA